MFIVEWYAWIGGDDPEVRVRQSFESEREARMFFNVMADGSQTIKLLEADGTPIVESAFPVLMVA